MGQIWRQAEVTQLFLVFLFVTGSEAPIYLQGVLLKEKNIDTGFWSSLLGFFKARAGDFPHDQLL